MLMDRKARLSTAAFVFVAVLLPMAGILIMNDQLSVANDVTGMATAVPEAGSSQVFAGLIMICLVVAGLVSLLFRFRSHVKKKKADKEGVQDVDSRIELLSEKIKQL